MYDVFIRVFFGFFEIGENVLVAPIVIPHRFPVVVISRISSDVHHVIYGAGTALKEKRIFKCKFDNFENGKLTHDFSPGPVATFVRSGQAGVFLRLSHVIPIYVASLE